MKLQKGHIPWNKGKTGCFKHTEEYKKRQSKLNSLENHPQWQGGKSFEPYGLEFNEKLKELLRERDKYCCRLCSVREDKVKLHIHHIDYDKTNNNPTNLISLCINCHMRTNHNRNRWNKFLSRLLNSKLEVVNFG